MVGEPAVALGSICTSCMASVSQSSASPALVTAFSGSQDTNRYAGSRPGQPEGEHHLGAGLAPAVIEPGVDHHPVPLLGDGADAHLRLEAAAPIAAGELIAPVFRVIIPGILVQLFRRIARLDLKVPQDSGLQFLFRGRTIRGSRWGRCTGPGIPRWRGWLEADRDTRPSSPRWRVQRNWPSHRDGTGWRTGSAGRRPPPGRHSPAGPARARAVRAALSRGAGRQLTACQSAPFRRMVSSTVWLRCSTVHSSRMVRISRSPSACTAVTVRTGRSPSPTPPVW